MGRSFKVLAIHKQTYPATYNFRDEADGTSETDIVFVDSSTNPADTKVQIISGLGGHKKVLEMFDNSAIACPEIFHTFSSAQESGTIEFWIRTSDAVKESSFYLYGTSIAFAFQITADKFQYYDGGWHDLGLACLDNVILVSIM